jgi:hypothetical protein
MARRSGILIGTAGVYHVASRLAAHGFHAAVTYGNAPSVDILVGLVDGSATVSLQVKTSYSALRPRGRGEDKTPHHYEWDVGKKSARVHRPDLFFAFIDLKGQSGQLPDVFIMPSKVVYDWFQGVITKHFDGNENRLKRWRFHPRISSVREFENRWDLLRQYLNQKAQPQTSA